MGCENSEDGCGVLNEDGIMYCTQAFMHLSFVHGWCAHDTMTDGQEELIHEYEGSCMNCQIFPPYNPDAPDCPAPDCDNPQPALDAYALLVGSCEAEGGDGSCCGTDELVSAWQTVVAYHDLCDHDDIPTEVENGYHDFEHGCEDSGCNSVAADYDGSICVPEEEHCEDFDEDHCEEHGCEWHADDGHCEDAGWTCGSHPGDTDGNGVIDILDILNVLSMFGDTV